MVLFDFIFLKIILFSSDYQCSDVRYRMLRWNNIVY